MTEEQSPPVRVYNLYGIAQYGSVTSTLVTSPGISSCYQSVQHDSPCVAGGLSRNQWPPAVLRVSQSIYAGSMFMFTGH